MTADSSIVDAKAVSEKETVSETLMVYDAKPSRAAAHF